jgi:hypothetical protein
MSRFKGKPVGGLPGRLPEGEKIIWQGAPEWRSLARYVFHLKMVAVYFGLLVIWRVVGASMSGHTMAYALTSGVSSILLGAAAIALFSLFAWLIARTTTYSITTRRLVITYGMALPKSLNLPFANIDGADLRVLADTHGDIALKLPAQTRLSYLLLWPHVRAGMGGRAEPVLRCLEDPQRVAQTLTPLLGATLATTERATVTDSIRAERPAMPQAQAA